ncbi:MAG: DNA recombination/repair protein RecA, partial [Chloroflexi bacterium]|nr:DNA recombination/repair protein RecA [Chloroflexota bacterium]
NKVAPPFRTAEFDITFDHGISKEGDLVDLGVSLGIIKKSGAFFSLGEERLGQGRENAKSYLREHPQPSEEIERQIRAKVLSSAAAPRVTPVSSVSDEPDAAVD